MATYKVLQDIEAEDKLLGPLTLRQFIYAMVAILCGYFCFIGISKNAYFLLIVFLPVMVFTGFLAFPWGRDQPTEVWALAKIRFMFIPRKRLWDQSGQKDLVTITAPKNIDKKYTDNLSQTEVISRLKTLADTIDSRGWAVKNVAPGQAQPSMLNKSDRLVGMSDSMQVVDDNISPDEDMLDETSNRTAAHFDQMISSSATTRRQHIVDEMKAAANQPQQTNQQTTTAQPATQQQATTAATNPQADTQANTNNQWYMSQTPNNAPPNNNPDNSNTNEDALSAQLKANKKSPEISNSNLPVIQPVSEQAQANQAPQGAAQPAQPQQPQPLQVTQAAPADGEKVTENNQLDHTNNDQPKDDKIKESREAVEKARLASNDDLNISTIARQANQPDKDKEVVISLH